MKLFGIFAAVLLSVAPLVQADSGGAGADRHYHALRPDAHAPIGVMGDHTHGEGEFMLSYRYMFMNMQGNRSGTSGVSTAEVLSQYMVSPTEMDMEMHMLGMMYAPADWFTFMTMVPIIDMTMDHKTRMGGSFRTSSSGLGDIRFTGLTRVYEGSGQRVHLNTGVSVPSGDTDVRDDTPAGADMVLPYPMQLGSGTVDLLPGITYLGQSGRISWGAQANGNIRTGRNDDGYSLGDEFSGTFWAAYQMSDAASFSFRNEYTNRGNIDGADSRLNPMMVPTADPGLRGGESYRFGFGLNFLVPEGALKGMRVAAEYLVPVYQDLDGPQLETDAVWVFGAQYSF